MTVEEIRRFVVSVDPNAGHYTSAYRDTDAYTIWYERRTLPIMGDNQHVGVRAFQIHRYTKSDADPIVAAFEAALEANDQIAFEHVTLPESPDSDYVHHVFDCEGC